MYLNIVRFCVKQATFKVNPFKLSREKQEKAFQAKPLTTIKTEDPTKNTIKTNIKLKYQKQTIFT